MTLVNTATLPELGKQFSNKNPMSQSLQLFVTILILSYLILHQFFEM